LEKAQTRAEANEVLQKFNYQELQPKAPPARAESKVSPAARPPSVVVRRRPALLRSVLRAAGSTIGLAIDITGWLGRSLATGARKVWRSPTRNFAIAAGLVVLVAALIYFFLPAAVPVTPIAPPIDFRPSAPSFTMPRLSPDLPSLLITRGLFLIVVI